jgi:hypothetical protein
MSKPNHIQKNGKTNGEPGRPSKFQEKFIVEGEALAQLGLPHRQMAWFWKVSEDTITDWKAKYPDFSDAIKKGEATRNLSLLKNMKENADKGNPAVQIFLAKNWLGMKDISDVALAGGEFPIKVTIVPHEWKKPKADNGTSGPKKG